MKGHRFAAVSAARFGILIAAAVVLGWAEAQIPPFFSFPGMKLGLTNIIVLVVLCRLGGKSAMTVNLLRIGIVALLFSGMMGFLYSLAGGMLSTLVMILLHHSKRFRTVTISIAGGVSHNIGQIIVAAIVMNTAALGWYLTVLWFSGMLSGVLIGILGSELDRRLPQKLFD